MAEQELTFRCSNCGFSGEAGSWWAVSQHTKKNAVCKAVGAKVLSVVNGIESKTLTTRAPLRKNMTDEEEQTWVASQTQTPVQAPVTPKPSMAEMFATRQIEEIEDDEVEDVYDGWDGIDDDGPDGPGDDEQDPDEGYNPNVARVRLGRTSAVELPAWVVATYEAFAGFGYTLDLSKWIEEQVALNMILLGVNVQIMPYSERERQAMLNQIGAIAQEVA